MPDQPERRNAVLSILLKYVVDDIAQVGVIGLGHPSSHRHLGGRRWRRDDEPMLFLVSICGEVRAWPCADRTSPMETQEKDQLFTGSEIVRIVNVELAPEASGLPR